MKKHLMATTLMALTLILAHAAVAQQQQRPERPEPPDAATMAKIEDCETSSGMPKRETHIKPTEEQRAKFEACLKSKNIKMPHPPGRGGPKQEESESNDGPPPPPRERRSNTGSQN